VPLPIARAMLLELCAPPAVAVVATDLVAGFSKVPGVGNAVRPGLPEATAMLNIPPVADAVALPSAMAAFPAVVVHAAPVLRPLMDAHAASAVPAEPRDDTANALDAVPNSRPARSRGFEIAL